MAEIGDKTRLATIALAVKYSTTIPVCVGTTTGMIISDGGIVVGNLISKHIPERAIKWVSGLVFIAFGTYGLYDNLPRHVWSSAIIVGGLIVLAVAIYGMARLGAGRMTHSLFV